MFSVFSIVAWWPTASTEVESLNSADDEQSILVLYWHGFILICIEGASVCKCDKELQASALEPAHLSVSSHPRKVIQLLLT